MFGEQDRKDKNEARKVAVLLIALVVILLLAAGLLFPAVTEIAAVHLSPGLGLKDSAVIAFFVTIVVMIVFAIAAGDGFIGEIQFMIGSFFLFFVIFWLMIAWIF